MKKVKLSLAALTLVLAIAGTTMANKGHKKVDPCSEVDPKGTICVGGIFDCCVDDQGRTLLQPFVNN